MIFPAELVEQIRLLEIKTDRAVDELLGGAYRSVFKGRGIEFEEVREYTPLDDVRDIDWNVTARAGGKAYVKKYVDERELLVLLAVDVSASGAFGSGSKSKRQSAAELAAMLAFSAGRNGDKVGLLMFSDQIELYVPPRSGRRHALRLIREILAFESKSSRTDIPLALRETAKLLKRRGIVFLLSDLIDDRDYVRELDLLHRRHDVIAVELYDRAERAWRSHLPMDVEDAETGEFGVFNGRNPALNQRLADSAERKREICRRARVDLVEVASDGDLLKPLAEFFRRRKERR